MKAIIETYTEMFTADDSLFKYMNAADEFDGTAERAKRFFTECAGYGEKPTEKAVRDILMKSVVYLSPGWVSPEITVPEFKTLGWCPHHFAPVNYKIAFSYRPRDCRVGLSKIIRYLRYLFRYPVVQEELTTLAPSLFRQITCAASASITVTGKHACTNYRGARSGGAAFVTTHQC